MSYLAVPLGNACCVGVAALESVLPPLIGEQVLRGLPFAIGSRPDRCYVGVGGDWDESTSIEVGAAGHWLVFAHRLLDSAILQAGPVGEHVADYVVHWADGTSETVVIRDRFEIGALPLEWGQLPFRAVPDGNDHPHPQRIFGRVDGGGGHFTDVTQVEPRDYYLFAWANPRPEVVVERVELRSTGPRVIVAGLCLGQTPEHPLRRPAARALRVDIDDQALGARPLEDLHVEVDRGTATTPYALPVSSSQAFLADDMAGFGYAVNPGQTPTYVHVSAQPSATVGLTCEGAELGSVVWGDLAMGKPTRGGKAIFTLVDEGRNWVRTTVLDDESGRPLPCRINFRSSQGVPYPPYGHPAHVGRDLNTWHLDVGGDVRLGSLSYAYIHGTCEGWLPRGDVLVDVARGFEYEPLRTQVRIESGQRELTLRLRRTRSMNAEGWWSGDTHVHFLSAQGALTEARGEDLSVVNLLQAQWGSLFTNTEDFTGEPLVSSDGQTVVWTSQENRQHVLGHLILLGLREPVMPWSTDGASEGELGSSLEVTLSEWADRCHEQGGTVIIPHLPNPNGEPATLLSTGRVDGVEFHAGSEYSHHEYYRYLNGGYQVPLVGGTDKMDAAVPVGLHRTYVRIPEDEGFSYESWCRNLARGRTFLSSGPLLRFTVDGAEIGDTLFVQAGASVEVEAEVTSIFPVHTLQVLALGQLVASADDAAGARRLTLRTTLRVEHDTWLAARAGGPDYFGWRLHHDCWTRGIFAHTSPIYLSCGDRYDVFSEATAQHMLTLIEGSMAYIRELSTQHPPGLVTHHHGHDDHVAHLLRPFTEAIDAVNSRLDEHGTS